MRRPNELTALEAITAIELGDLTAETLLRASLERIAEREVVVGAWTCLDADAALAAAREVDAGRAGGPMRGLPFGAKDIIDTADIPTEYGSPIYAGHRPAWDAACVALSRRAGAILLGKTVTTEFANLHPGKTANPHDPAHTPGGSSSGSAAAVADFMVPLALGTQTTQSTIRPAAFCGVYGYCPSQGDFRLAGVREAAGSFDRLGLIARAIGDIALWRAVLLHEAPRPPGPVPDRPPRIGFCRTVLWDDLEPATRAAMEEAAQRLGRAGAAVRDVELPGSFRALPGAHRQVSSFEFARNFTHEIERHWDRISETLRRGRIADGLACTFAEYRAACAEIDACRARLPEIFADIDILITASAPGEAPEGLHATGSATLGALLTPLALPCLTIPAFSGPSGLPMGLQVLAAAGADDQLLDLSRWIDRALR